MLPPETKPFPANSWVDDKEREVSYHEMGMCAFLKIMMI